MLKTNDTKAVMFSRNMLGAIRDAMGAVPISPDIDPPEGVGFNRNFTPLQLEELVNAVRLIDEAMGGTDSMTATLDHLHAAIESTPTRQATAASELYRGVTLVYPRALGKSGNGWERTFWPEEVIEARIEANKTYASGAAAALAATGTFDPRTLEGSGEPMTSYQCWICESEEQGTTLNLTILALADGQVKTNRYNEATDYIYQDGHRLYVFVTLLPQAHINAVAFAVDDDHGITPIASLCVPLPN